MLFSAINRVKAFDLLPETGNIATLILVKNAKEKLAFTEEEIEQYGIDNQPGRVTWKEPVPDKEIELGEIPDGWIRARLTQMDDNCQLSLEYLDLFMIYCQDRLKVISEAAKTIEQNEAIDNNAA